MSLKAQAPGGHGPEALPQLAGTPGPQRSVCTPRPVFCAAWRPPGEAVRRGRTQASNHRPEFPLEQNNYHLCRQPELAESQAEVS